MEHSIDPVTGDKLRYHVDAEIAVYSGRRLVVCYGIYREDLAFVPNVVSDYMKRPKVTRIWVENKRLGETLVIHRTVQ